jgi:hypothetical protein
MTTSATPAIEGVVPEEFDLVVLGTGEGARYLAWTLARQGKKLPYSVLNLRPL